MLARIERTDDEPWPSELHELTVNVASTRPPRSTEVHKKKITGPDLRLLGAPDGAKLLLFPVEDIRPGETIVDLTVLDDVRAVGHVAGRWTSRAGRRKPGSYQTTRSESPRKSCWLPH